MSTVSGEELKEALMDDDCCPNVCCDKEKTPTIHIEVAAKQLDEVGQGDMVEVIVKGKVKGYSVDDYYSNIRLNVESITVTKKGEGSEFADIAEGE